MRDVICIEGLRVRALIGIYPYEGETRQPLVIDMRLHTDVRQAGETRDFSLTMDYERAANIAREIAEEGHEKLIETVAERIAGSLRAEFGPRLEQVWVRVAKPSALGGGTVVAVEVTR